MPTVTTQTFYGDVQNIASGMIPRIYGRSYAIEAELSVPDGGAEGVIVAEADEMGGFSLWVDEKGLLHHSYSMMGVERYEQVSTEPIPTGDVTVRMQFDADRQERGCRGNGLPVRERREDRRGPDREDGRRPLLRVRGMDVGRDNGLVVDRAYAAKAPYAVHRDGEEGRLRPQAGQPRGGEGAARGRRARRRGAGDQRIGAASGA